jgi:hypothetical protein
MHGCNIALKTIVKYVSVAMICQLEDLLVVDFYMLLLLNVS